MRLLISVSAYTQHDIKGFRRGQKDGLGRHACHSYVLYVLPMLNTGDTIVDNAPSTAKVGALLLQELSEPMTHG
jgi:hypothetical protein